jgi:hypothetical protein
MLQCKWRWVYGREEKGVSAQVTSVDSKQGLNKEACIAMSIIKNLVHLRSSPMAVACHNCRQNARGCLYGINEIIKINAII